MPQLVKGGKYIFGWANIGKEGQVKIPPKAIKEYGFMRERILFLLSGSKTSGGFGLTSKSLLKDSVLIKDLELNKRFFNLEIPEGKIVKIKNKSYCWLRKIDLGTIKLSQHIKKEFHLEENSRLLVGRGSRYVLAFISRGSIFKEALNHPKLNVF